MFVLTPVSALHSPAARPHYRPHQPSPRDRYLTALAEARAAEIEYANSLAREEAIRRQREEERIRRQREEALARRQRQEAIRRQILLDALRAQDVTYVADTPYAYDAPYHPLKRQYSAYAEAEVERRAALQRAAHEQEVRQQEWQRLASLRRQQSQGIRAQQARDLSERQGNDVERFLSFLSGRPAEPRAAAEVHPQSQPTKPSQSSVPSENEVPEGLKDRLESRLMSEYEGEIRDTLQALLSSLTSPDAPKAQPKEGNDQKSDAPVVDKGKDKQVTFDVPPATAAPTSKDVLASLETVRNIDTAYHALSSEFEFPRDLDFDSTPSTPSSIDFSTSSNAKTELKMAYTSRNTPVRYYEHALSALLTQLDAVESFDNEDVRLERKKVVAKVEGALEDLERGIEERLEKFKWKLRREAASETMEVKKKKNVLTTDESKEVVDGQEGAAPEPVDIPMGDGQEITEAILPSADPAPSEELSAPSAEVVPPAEAESQPSDNSQEMAGETDVEMVANEPTDTAMVDETPSLAIPATTADASEGTPMESQEHSELPSIYHSDFDQSSLPSLSTENQTVDAISIDDGTLPIDSEEVTTQDSVESRSADDFSPDPSTDVPNDSVNPDLAINIDVDVPLTSSTESSAAYPPVAVAVPSSPTLTSTLSSAPSSPLESTPSSPEVDTFLLPASRASSPSKPSQGVEDDSDELVVVDHEEQAGDGQGLEAVSDHEEGWSEVEA
ncbi:hypothetical protein BV22DRAFT_1029627 [Leucogyrophana mollusca]|uniref:Uncharacterized protein n=1 Tax=Leucogyrophana mollusca TaxID=85980 RepID=A0ACB8BV09_9AGAM|nr:hypothetical protein BV22DRAFT_1029627 [Leucogyrophana mollusca]